MKRRVLASDDLHGDDLLLSVRQFLEAVNGVNACRVVVVQPQVIDYVLFICQRTILEMVLPRCPFAHVQLCEWLPTIDGVGLIGVTLVLDASCMAGMGVNVKIRVRVDLPAKKL